MYSNKNCFVALGIWKHLLWVLEGFEYFKITVKNKSALSEVSC